MAAVASLALIDHVSDELTLSLQACHPGPFVHKPFGQTLGWLGMKVTDIVKYAIL